MLTRNTFAFVFSFVIAGCAGTAVEPRQVDTTAAHLPPTAADGTYTVVFPSTGNHVGRSHRLAVGPAEPVQCRFSPHFEFGSSEPLPQDMLELRSFAECLNGDVARDKPVEIVGHADPRGPSDRNLRLALARAERVRDILIHYGVQQDRMHVRSVGEQGAVGFLSAYSYGFDRRVDVALLYEPLEPNVMNQYQYGVPGWR